MLVQSGGPKFIHFPVQQEPLALPPPGVHYSPVLAQATAPSTVLQPQTFLSIFAISIPNTNATTHMTIVSEFIL